VVATYRSDGDALAGAQVYYSYVAGASSNAIITRADFNTWWATAERKEQLRTSFFQVLVETWAGKNFQYGPTYTL